MAKKINIDGYIVPKWATHVMQCPADGERMWAGKGKVQSLEWDEADIGEDDSYTPEHFGRCGWRIELVRPLVLENK